MKTKRFIAMPGLLALFVCLLIVCYAAIQVALLNLAKDMLITVILVFLLVCMMASLFVIGITTGAFDMIIIGDDSMTVRRFGKKVHCYLISQNTQLHVRNVHKGAKYIEVEFPEYFDTDVRNLKPQRLRDGYVCLDFSKARFAYVESVLHNYKTNIAPIEQPPLV